MVKCSVPGCEQPYKNNAGLGSHMRMRHGLNVDGTPIPPEVLAQQKKNLSDAVRKAAHANDIVAAHKPESRAKAAATNRERHYEKLKAQGVHRCPECMAEGHRKVDFKSAAELGRHRRFKHKILGREAMKQEAEKGEEKVSAFKCPQCDRTFPRQAGLSIHISQAHKKAAPTELVQTLQEQELINGHVTERTVQHHTNGKAGGSHSHDAALAEAIAVAYTVGNIESVLSHASYEYDCPPKRFAKRVILALVERYP